MCFLGWQKAISFSNYCPFIPMGLFSRTRSTQGYARRWGRKRPVIKTEQEAVEAKIQEPMETVQATIHKSVGLVHQVLLQEVDDEDDTTAFKGLETQADFGEIRRRRDRNIKDNDKKHYFKDEIAFTDLSSRADFADLWKEKKTKKHGNNVKKIHSNNSLCQARGLQIRECRETEAHISEKEETTNIRENPEIDELTTTGRESTLSRHASNFEVNEPFPSGGISMQHQFRSEIMGAYCPTEKPESSDPFWKEEEQEQDHSGEGNVKDDDGASHFSDSVATESLGSLITESTNDSETAFMSLSPGRSLCQSVPMRHKQNLQALCKRWGLQSAEVESLLDDLASMSL